MKFSVDFNGDLDLIPELVKSNDVGSISIRMFDETADFSNCNKIQYDLDGLEEITKTVHGSGKKVKYIADSTCKSNKEYTKAYNDRLFENINSVINVGVDGLVVSSPFMLGYVKENWPNAEVTISRFTSIDTIEKAKYWEGIGADVIVLSSVISRDFNTLKLIRDAIKCKLELSANLGCIYSCPDERFHGLYTSHNLMNCDNDNRLPVDYYSLNCSLYKMKNPAEFIKSRWIRPEDVYIYENLGINSLSVYGGKKDSKWLLNTVKAYSDRKYNGNLLDIIYSSDCYNNFLSNDCENKEILDLVNSIKDVQVYVENNNLDGFVKRFVDFDCSKAICKSECDYCYKKSDEILTYNKENAIENSKIISGILNIIHEKSMLS